MKSCTGKILKVDLTTGTTAVEKIPDEVVTHDLSLYLNYVYAYFVTKFRLPDKKFVSADGTPSCQTLLEEMRADAPMLGIYGIGNAEITIMAHSL